MNERTSALSSRSRAALALACLLVATTAMPASLGWMRGGAASFFTDRDWDLISETLRTTLETAADGETREWSNDKSGASGSMTPLASETRADMTCRKLRIESHARGASSADNYTFCRRGDGPWGIGEPK